MKRWATYPLTLVTKLVKQKHFQFIFDWFVSFESCHVWRLTIGCMHIHFFFLRLSMQNRHHFKLLFYINYCCFHLCFYCKKYERVTSNSFRIRDRCAVIGKNQNGLALLEPYPLGNPTQRNLAMSNQATY